MKTSERKISFLKMDIYDESCSEILSEEHSSFFSQTIQKILRFNNIRIYGHCAGKRDGMSVLLGEETEQLTSVISMKQT